MNRNILLAFGITLLFLGVGINPAIATVEPEIIDVEYYDVTTEFIGLNKEYTTQLSREQLEELDALFDSIKNRINMSSSMEESVEVYKDAVIKLEKLGLLGDVGINETEKLVINYYQNPNLMKILDRVNNQKNGNLSEERNIFCLIAGKVENIDFFNPLVIYPLFLILLLMDYFNKMDYWFYLLLIFGFAVLFNFYNPICIFNQIILGTDTYNRGEIISFGLLGLRYWKGDDLDGLIKRFGFSFGIGVIGFTGLNIEYFNFRFTQAYFLGGAILAHIKAV